MKRLLVTGASGLLGFNLCMRQSSLREITGVTFSQGLRSTPFKTTSADLTNAKNLISIINQEKPDGIIHCAAMANIDACEKHPEKAWQINADVPGEIADICARKGIRFVHISTDAVFDGEKGSYRENDQTNPLSVYARTKLAGEDSVLRVNAEAIIARVNFYGWSLTGKRSLAEFFYYNLSAGKSVNGFTDVEFCPLFVDQLSDILIMLADGGLSGLYHVVSPESLTKYDFGCRLASAFGIDPDLVQPISVHDGGLTARRSPKLTLNTEKLWTALNIPLPDLKEGFRAFSRQHTAGYPESIARFVV